MLAYEYVPTESPYLFEVTPFACGSPHQVRTNSMHACMYTIIVGCLRLLVCFPKSCVMLSESRCSEVFG